LNSVISIEGLKKAYPVVKNYRELLFHPLKKKYTVALDGIDLQIQSGKCFCLLGPNGAGKTTLIKILSTLVLPDEGIALVDGLDVKKDAHLVKTRIGFAMNEERSFSWRLTGRQNLEFYASLYNIPRSRIRAHIQSAIEFTGLDEAIDFRFNTYSSGMRQMLSFARALLTDSRIVFVDEPTRSLDPQSAERVRTFLKHELVMNQGRTVFWATHDLTEAQGNADELAIIVKGQIRACGTVPQLTRDGELSILEVYHRTVGSCPDIQNM
jgi:ABC-2 type transport system ATP-binding protein